MDTIKVKVDGKTVEVPATMPDPISGKPVPTTMLQACRLASVTVPHYCYHKKLPIAGNCRMCLVEYGTPVMGADKKPLLNPDGTPKIAKSPRPAIACATPVTPGMEIYTNTPEVKKMREAVLEFLLINHPLDCPICDQAGECKLQEYSFDYGAPVSEFIESKVHKPKQVVIGPYIMYDAERCILCTRCIRFTRDIVGDDALGIVNRGSYNAIAVYPGRSFDNNYTLNTVDICPVGALTSRDFRFQMRVWFLKQTKSICASCATGCNIIIDSRKDIIYRYRPRENDFVNSCWMCDYGRLNYKWIGRKDRLCVVVVKNKNGVREEIDWTTALKEIAGHLKNVKPGTTAIIASARLSNEELWLLSKIKKLTGAISDSVPRFDKGDNLLLNSDRNPNTNGAVLTGISARRIGDDLPKIKAAVDSGDVKTVIVFGEDLIKIGFTPTQFERLDKLIVCNVLPDSTTALANYLLPGCAYAEKSGTFTNIKFRVQKFYKAVEPPQEARPEYEILSELLFHLTGERLPQTAHELFDKMTNEVAAFNNMRWEKLGDTGIQIDTAGIKL